MTSTCIGFIADLFDNDETSVSLTYAHASDITDGFTGLTVMPFIVSKQDTNNDGNADNYVFDAQYRRICEPYRADDQYWRLGRRLACWCVPTWPKKVPMSMFLSISGSWSHTDPERIYPATRIYELMGHGVAQFQRRIESPRRLCCLCRRDL
jgi:hypothetical protein